MERTVRHRSVGRDGLRVHSRCRRWRGASRCGRRCWNGVSKERPRFTSRESHRATWLRACSTAASRSGNEETDAAHPARNRKRVLAGDRIGPRATCRLTVGIVNTQMKLAFSHPTGNANSRAALEAMNDALLLDEFYTAVAVFPGGVWDRLSRLSFAAALTRREFTPKGQAFDQTMARSRVSSYDRKSSAARPTHDA